jgi:hypothetical protein
MAENNQTKICRRCAETIKSAARVCPYCRTPQNRLIFISEHEACAIGAVMFFVGFAFLAFWIFGTGREYSPQRYKITVLSCQFGIEATRDHTNAIVSGVLTNESDYKWDVTRFEIRFLDSAGKIIDTDSAGSEYDALSVLPHSECPFHLGLYMKALPAFSSSQITIKEAKDP